MVLFLINQRGYHSAPGEEALKRGELEMKKIIFGTEEEALGEALESYCRSRYPVALTGAGISVESGIADFRSPGGLWSVFNPDEYATIDVFLDNPRKAWKLYRAMYGDVHGKEPNAAHIALARLEEKGLLKHIITQNVDGLHQKAGSRSVIAIHGDSEGLICVNCGYKVHAEPTHFSGYPPRCPDCRNVLKPDYVLFGEPVRHMDEIEDILELCDAILIIGTSCQVYPAAGFPARVRRRGGSSFEFNLRETTGGFVSFLQSGAHESDFFFQGPASVTVTRFADGVLSA